jgi:hypothetical protein
LCCDHHPMPIQAIGNDSTDWREQAHRNLTCAYRAEKGRGFRDEVASLLSVTKVNLIPPPICLGIERLVRNEVLVADLVRGLNGA